MTGAVLVAIGGSRSIDISVTQASWLSIDSSPNAGFCLSTYADSGGSNRGSRSPTSYNSLTLSALYNYQGATSDFLLAISGNNTGAKFNNIYLVQDAVSLSRSAASTPNGVFDGTHTLWNFTNALSGKDWSGSGVKTVRILY